MKQTRIVAFFIVVVIFVLSLFFVFLRNKRDKTPDFKQNKALIARMNLLRKKADKFDSLKKNKDAVDAYRQFLDLALILKDNEAISYAYNSIALCFKREGKFSNALENYRKALVFASKIKNRKKRLKRFASIYFNLAILFDFFNFYQKSIEFFNLAAESYIKLGFERDLYDTYGNVALVYRKIGDYKKALYYTKKAYNYFLKKKDWYNVCVYSNNLGYFYLNRGNLRKSEYYHRIALKLANKNGFKNMLPYIYSGMGEFYFKKKDYKSSLRYQILAEKTAGGDLEVLKYIYRAFADLYYEIGNEEKAVIYLEKYNKLMLSCFKPQNFEKFENLFTMIEREKQKQKLALLEKEKEIQGLMGKLYFIAFVFVVILIYLVFYMYKAKRKMNLYLEIISKRDALTNLFNRREMMVFLNEEVLRFERKNNPFSVVICDIDDFKKINDTYGHACGDSVLKRIADIFIENLRKTDVVARWGGEEFLFLLPETDENNALMVVEKIRRAVNEESFMCGNKEFSVSLTFGLCAFTEGLTIDKVIDLADKALYKGKKDGKNRVVVCTGKENG